MAVSVIHANWLHTFLQCLRLMEHKILEAFNKLDESVLYTEYTVYLLFQLMDR